MDFSWIIGILIFALVLAGGYVLISRLIMPAIPPAIQVWLWAVIGICLLIMLLYFAGGHFGAWSNVHGPSLH